MSFVPAHHEAAGSLTHQVYDQYLRRRSNQVFFGFFIGVTLYALLTLATVDDTFIPVFGATLTLLLTATALLLLLLLLYSAVYQMRPATIIDTIHAPALTARYRLRPRLCRRTARDHSLDMHFNGQVQP